MSGKVVLCVGAVLRGDDAAGPYLAKLLENDPAEGWEVIDGGQVPEDYLGVVRRKEPDELVMVDAADMGLPAGEVRVLTEDDVSTDYLMTTHSLPISFLLSELRGCCGKVTFLGVQPVQLEFFGALTPEVLQSVEWIHTRLKEGGDFSDVPSVWADEDKGSVQQEEEE